MALKRILRDFSPFFIISNPFLYSSSGSRPRAYATIARMVSGRVDGGVVDLVAF